MHAAQVSCCTNSPRSRLLLAARQEWLERPLDRARAGTDCGLAAVGPGLRALELGAAPHEAAAVCRLVLPATAFPAALKIDFLAVDRPGALLGSGFDGGVAQPHHMIVAHRPTGNRDLDSLARLLAGKRQLVAHHGAAIGGVEHFRRDRLAHRRHHRRRQHRMPHPHHCRSPCEFSFLAATQSSKELLPLQFKRIVPGSTGYVDRGCIWLRYCNMAELTNDVAWELW